MLSQKTLLINSTGHPIMHRTPTQIRGCVLVPRTQLSCSCPVATTKWNTTAVEFLFLFFKIELFNSWVFFEESAAKGFTDSCVCDNSCGILWRTTGNLFNVSKSYSSCFSTGRNEMKYSFYQERFLCYSKLFCLFGLA